MRLSEEDRRRIEEEERYREQVREEEKDRRTQKQRKQVGIGCLVIILLAVGIGTCVAVTTGGEEGGQAELEPEVGAKSVCNQFVKPQLRNPESADFKGLGGMGGVATRLPGPTPQWRVTSHVDTKTDLGITKRIAFECTVEHVEGDRWRLIDLDLTDLGVK